MFYGVLALFYQRIPRVTGRTLSHPAGGVVATLLTDKYGFHFGHGYNIEAGGDNRVTDPNTGFKKGCYMNTVPFLEEAAPITKTIVLCGN